MPDWQEIGRISSVNPARRELRVACRPEEERALLAAQWVLVKGTKCKVESARAGGEVIVTLSAGVSRDLVGQMRHAMLSAEAVAPPHASEAECAPEDLLDLLVLDADGKTLGTIVEVMETPAHAVLVIETPEEARWLLPAIPQVIMCMDLNAQTLTVRDIQAFVVVEAEEEADAG